MQLEYKIIFTIVLLGLLNPVSAAVHLAPQKVKAPDDLTYMEGSTGNELIWQFFAHESADSPTTYTVTIDGSNLQGHIDASWQDNVDIVVNVDGLSVGMHTVVITVNDSGTDNQQAPAATDTVIVTVTSAVTSTSTNMNTTSTIEDTTSTNIVSTTSESTSSSVVDTSEENATPFPGMAFMLSIFFSAFIVIRRIKYN